MTPWSEMPQSNVVDRLSPVPASLRVGLGNGPFTPTGHYAAFDAMAVLREIGQGGTVPSRSGLASVRLLFWNVERLRHLDAIAAYIQAHQAAIFLLSERWIAAWRVPAVPTAS